jgi:hypothetical protein
VCEFDLLVHCLETLTVADHVSRFSIDQFFFCDLVHLFGECRHNLFSKNGALKTIINWAKHFTEEQDTPCQIKLEYMGTNSCILVSIALWLEVSLSRIPNAM